MNAPRYIAYYRVSTDRQGRSGLGLEAQQQAVSRHINGGQLVAEYTEVESGKRSDRPELAAALARCRRERATLIIAKLDRLGRNVAFIASLMEAGVDFVCCDNPQANKLMLHMLAAFAEHEREQISQRTKDALQAAKARGVQLGNPQIAELNRRQADQYAETMRPVIEDLKAEGFTSIRQLRDEMNRREIPTNKGKSWHLQTVHSLLSRVQAV